MMTIIGEDCDLISRQKLAVPYKSGKRAEENKTYSVYLYNGTGFIVNDEDRFTELFNNGGLQKVLFEEGVRTVDTLNEETGEVESAEVKTLTYQNCISIQQDMNRAKHASDKARLADIKSIPVTEDLLAKLASL